MKTTFAIFILAAFLASCSTESSAPVTDTITDNTWEITYFWDKDKDETYHFTSWEIEFQTDGTLLAKKTGTVISGTWSEGSSSSGSEKIIMNFGTQEPFEELNDDWDVTDKSSTEIKLKDESGSGGTEILHFRKK